MPVVVRACLVAMLVALTGCAGNMGPYAPSIGREAKAPPVTNFRGRPVVQVTFVVNAEPLAEAAFLNDYMRHPLRTVSSNDPNEPFSGAGGGNVEYATASDNLKAMFVKNAFYAFHLAKFLKIKAGTDFAVILNPVKLKHDPTDGYSYEPFENNMPPADIEIFFMSYVHPNTKPSTLGDSPTTYGDSLAPVVSIRIDPKFNPAVGGAVALNSNLVPFAYDRDGRGMRAELIDYVNFMAYNSSGRYKSASGQLGTKSRPSGEFQFGEFYRLPFGSFDLDTKPIPPEVIPAAVMSGQDYRPGTYDAYGFYNTYYRIIIGALQYVNNNKAATTAQKRYWSFYDSSDLEGVMLGTSDRGKRRFITQATNTEIEYLEDRDRNWMKAVLDTNNFGVHLNTLRNAEVTARKEYVAAQTKAAVGILLALAGAATSVRTSNPYAAMAGVAALGIGVGLVVNSLSELKRVDAAFSSSFSQAYSSQKAYVFETAEGEKVEIRAKDYAEFKNHLKARYDSLFPAPKPTS